MDILEFYKRFILKEPEKLWRDYKYHVYYQVAVFKTIEEMKENMSRGVSETQWAALCGYWESEERHVS